MRAKRGTSADGSSQAYGRPVFKFQKWGTLSDGVVDLVVEQEDPADPTRGFVPCYHFGILRHGDPRKVGEARLRVGTLDECPSLAISGQLGYIVEPQDRGHGFAARACRLLRPVARAHGLDPVLITCDPENIASLRTCQQLGATFVGTFDIPPDHPMYRDGRRQVCRFEWHLTTDDRPPDPHPGI